jgi:hypothetical protein
MAAAVFGTLLVNTCCQMKSSAEAEVEVVGEGTFGLWSLPAQAMKFSLLVEMEL